MLGLRTGRIEARDGSGHGLAHGLGQPRHDAGAVTTAGESLTPPILSAFRERNPGIEVRLEVGNRGAVFDRLRSRDADLGIGGWRA